MVVTEILERAGRLLADYQSCYGIDKAAPVQQAITHMSCRPPASGLIKINAGTAVRRDKEYTGIGVVARDECCPACFSQSGSWFFLSPHSRMLSTSRRDKVSSQMWLTELGY